MQFDKTDKPKPIYVGSGKEMFEGDVITFSLDLTHIEQLSEWFNKGSNGKTYVQLKVQKKRETDQWGKTHSVQIDQFKPKPKTDQAPNTEQRFSQEQAEEEMFSNGTIGFS
jgi:hypothetical protein